MDNNKELPGNDSRYAFICYSHADGETTKADADWLEEQAISVWYDRHIIGGVDWNNELACQIQNCTWFLFFVSPKSVESIHCKNELIYAQQHGKRIIAIEIEPTEIPPGLQLTLNNRQFLFRHKLERAEFLLKLKEALHRKAGVPVRRGSNPDQSAISETFPKRKWAVLVSAAISLLVIIAVFKFLPLGKHELDFEKRDWIIVGELDNRTGDPLLSDTLKLGLRIALEQSNFANVVPDSLVQAARSRMQQDLDTPLDRNAGIELAQREGAKAIIVGSVSQFGDTYRIDIEIVDTLNGSTVWAATANAEGLSEILSAIDDISRQTREQLGESLANIESSSLPLAKVTTGDLEALRAYSLSQNSIARGDWEGGIDLLQRALEIDPQFAMAHGKLATIYFSSELFNERAATHWQLAADNKDRLSQREQLYVDASSAWLKTPVDMRAGWKAMSSLFPDQAVGFHNLGQVLRIHFAEYGLAAEQFTIAANLPNPWRFASYQYLAQCQLALGMIDDAMANFNIAFQMENNPLDFGMSDGYVVLRQYDEAQKFLNKAREMESPRLKLEAKFRQLGLYSARGQIAEALDLTNSMLLNATIVGQAAMESRIRAAQVALLEHKDDKDNYRTALADALKFENDRLVIETGPFPKVMLTHLAVLTRIAVRSGETGIAQASIDLLRERIPGNGFPIDQAYLDLLESELLLQDGAAVNALERVQRSLAQTELFQSHESLFRIYQRLGNVNEQRRELEWLIEHRGLAFAEQIDRYYGQLFNILDLLSLEQIHQNLSDS